MIIVDTSNSIHPTEIGEHCWFTGNWYVSLGFLFVEVEREVFSYAYRTEKRGWWTIVVPEDKYVKQGPEYIPEFYVHEVQSCGLVK